MALSYCSPVEPKPVTARLFYLNDELKLTADNLRNLFMQLPTRCRTDRELLYTRLYNKKRLIPDIKVLPFNALIELMNPEMYSADGRNSCRPYSDVVVILGHSNVFNFGSLDISDILEALLYPKPPSLVVFLGCCGGNGRYGPLTMLSQLPEWQNTVFSFYQRRMYIDELFHTSPVLAIQYYVHLVRADSVKETKDNIHRAFTDANRDPRFAYKPDIALLLNCKEEQTAQTILKMVKNFNISTEEIPLSCWQLALYHIFTVEKSGGETTKTKIPSYCIVKTEPTIKKFIADTKEELESLITQPVKRTYKEVKGTLIAKVDERCKAELKDRRLYDIIDLAHELQLLQVTEETLDLLRNNKWQDVNHLQFFVAMLHGYWGKNDYNNLRAYATYHIMKVIKPIAIVTNPSEHELHTYHLCCVGYCLFAPEIRIISDENDPYNEKFGFCLWGSDIPFHYALKCFQDDNHAERYINIPPGQYEQYRKKYLIARGSLESVITAQGYQFILNNQIVREPYLVTLNALPTIEDELPWIDVFDLRIKDCRFVELFNSRRDDYDMHSFRKDECKCKGRTPCNYQYRREDLISALKALKDCLFPTFDPDDGDQCLKHYYKYYYCIKEFQNRDSRNDGHMACFRCKPGVFKPINYLEMRVIHDLETLKKLNNSRKNALLKDRENDYEKDWLMVSRCRFVFAYVSFKKGETKQGTLFFTDSHYGQDMICKRLLGEKLGVEDIDKKDYFKMSEDLNKRQMYDLQEKCLQTIIVNTLQEMLDTKVNLQGLLVRSKNLQILEEVYEAVKKALQTELIKINLQKLLSDWLGNYLKRLFVEKLNEVNQPLVTNWQEEVGKMLQDSIKDLKPTLTTRGVYPFREIGILTITRNDPPLLEWHCQQTD